MEDDRNAIGDRFSVRRGQSQPFDARVTAYRDQFSQAGRPLFLQFVEQLRTGERIVPRAIYRRKRTRQFKLTGNLIISLSLSSMDKPFFGRINK